MPYGRHISPPSSLKLELINARSVNNETQLIHNLILDEGADLACITEIWLGGEDNVNLSLFSLLVWGYSTRLAERDGEEVSL